MRLDVMTEVPRLDRAGNLTSPWKLELLIFTSHNFIVTSRTAVRILELRRAVRQEGSTGMAHCPSLPRETSQRKTAGKRKETKSLPPQPIPSWRLSTKSATLYNESD
jgi:hypothetical protein